MAKSAAEVLEFLSDLASRAKAYAERDIRGLRDYAGQELGLNDLQPWDVRYVAEKLRAKRFAFSDQEVKEYFQELRVLEGLFRVVETIYGLKISPGQAPVWHDDVKFFDIRDQGGVLTGQFYLDLYARESKRGGAWMDDAITRRRTPKGVQLPVAYLTCNFSKPVGGKPALFTHDEVITLFHEFGHGLHHLLTQIDEIGVSGINGVEWDAVELPSQFMENFCWEWEVLRHMTSHVETSAPLPRELFDKMLTAKNFLAGMDMVRQLEFSLFDLHLHADYSHAAGKTPLALLQEIRRQVAVVFPPEYDRFPNSFSHIFAGGYAAGYYSYKWAEVLSADAYSLFEEQGVLNAEAGSRFQREILSVGGSRPALQSFIAFRGREPRIDALLRHSGLAAAA
jgi:oligopeptidase A